MDNRRDIMTDIIQRGLLASLFLTFSQVGVQSCCCVGEDVYWRRSQPVSGNNEHSGGPSDDQEQLH